MWTSTLELDPKRIFLTQLLGRFWPGAYFSFSAPLRVQNVPREALAASNWVRVRNRLAGICGSDLHLIYVKGDLRVAPAALPGRQPFYLGHEVVGEVIEIGDEVQHLRIGDRVVLQYRPNCLSTGALPLCHFCASGYYNFCERGELPGPLPLGGGWSEEMLLPEQQLFRVSADLSDEQAVMLEPAAVALHAVLRRLPQAGEHILVVGAGTIGLLTVALVRIFAPQARVSVLARYPFQIEQATRLGAEHIIYAQDSYQGVQQATKAEIYQGWFGNQMLLGGFDVIYDTIGSQSTLHHALRWARAGSTLVLVGSDLHIMHIDMTPIWYQEISLLGSLSHGIENWPLNTTNKRSTFDIAAELIRQRRLAPEQLITHRFALTDYQHALTTAAGKSQSRAIKIVFDYALLPASVVPNVRASARPRRPASSNEQLFPLDTPEPSAEMMPPEDNLPAPSLLAQPQQSWQEQDLVKQVEEDTEKVLAIKKAVAASPEDELETIRQENTPEYSDLLESAPAEQTTSAIPSSYMSATDEIAIWPDMEQSKLSQPPDSDDAQANKFETSGSDDQEGLSLEIASEDARDNHEGLLLREEDYRDLPRPEEDQEELSLREKDHERFSWVSRASEAISSNNYEGFSWTSIPSEATAGNNYEGLLLPEKDEAEVPVADTPNVVQAVEVETIKQEEPSAEVVEQEEPSTDVEVIKQEESAVEESVWWIEQDTAGQAEAEIVEAPTESMYPISVESMPVVSTAEESAVSEPLQAEVAIDESESNPQEEPVQTNDEEMPQPVIANEQTLNDANDTGILSNGKARQGTRKKRATKEGSDALLQVDATPGERKRSRPRARKKSQVEE
jgi:threonine dehydrogenase-like Zn-dependent dehydrogenase